MELFLRANAYSLVRGLGVSADEAPDIGPGSFSGPFVEGEQARCSYGVVFLLSAGWLLRRRDVS